MARTLKTKARATAEERAAAVERSERRRAGLLKAARIKTPEQIAALPPVKPEPVRARALEDSETEPDEETFSAPQPLQVIKFGARRGASAAVPSGGAAGCVAAARTFCSRARGCTRTSGGTA